MASSYFCEQGNNTELYLNGTFFFDVCYHDTGPVVLPLLYSFIIIIPYLMYIGRYKKPIAHFFRRRRGHGPIPPMKIILSMCYLGLHLCETVFALKLIIFGDYQIVSHITFRLLIAIIVSLFILAANLMEMKRDIVISTCLFLMWLLLLLINSLRLAVAIIQSWHLNYPNDVAFGCTIVAITVVLLQTILYGFIGAKTGTVPDEDASARATDQPPQSPMTPLTPIEEDMKRFDENPPSPEPNTSVVSMLTYWWIQSFVIQGWRRPIQPNHIYQLPFSERCHQLSTRFSEAWQSVINPPVVIKTKPQPLKPVTLKQVASKEKTRDVASQTTEASQKLLEENETKTKPKRPACLVIRALFRAFGPLFFFGGLIQLAQVVALLMSPVLMMFLTEFVKEQGRRPVWQGYAIAGGLLIAGLLQASFFQRFFYFMAVTSLRFRGALAAAIYDKSLRLSSAARQQTSTGETVNLVASDTANLLQITGFLHFVWSVPVQVIAVICLLWLNMGLATLAGLGVTIGTMLVSGICARIAKRFQFEKLRKKDQRVKLINEALSNIKTVKVYAWEEAIQEKIDKARDEELVLLRKSMILNLTAQTIWLTAPVAVALATFATYISLNPEANLDPGNAFVSLVLFNLLRFALVVLPQAISNLVQYLVSLKRIATFLLLDELDPKAVSFHNDSSHRPGDNLVLEIRDGSFDWDQEQSSNNQKPLLSDINLKVKRGQIVAIVGGIGSGKSSLLSAILGEMEKISGSVSIYGKVAYLPQTPWILNATLKENILFSTQEDAAFYRQVIEACALMPDLEMLPGGELAEIGEKGANLSGGQKQRVALARAVYSRADVYLLDDTLSAVDSYTGQHLFDRVIGPSGILAGGGIRPPATRIWVTHKMNFLPKCDHIVYISNGRIISQGSFDQLLTSCEQFAEVMGQHIASSRSERKSVDMETSVESSGVVKRRKSSLLEAIKPGNERITEAEKIAEGAVKFSVYGTYVKAMGVLLTIGYVITATSVQGFGVAAQNWLSTWTAAVAVNATAALPDKHFHFSVYCALCIVQSFCMFCATILLGIASLRASRCLHSRLIASMLRTTIQFFEATPISRILNRFAKDMDTVDNILSDMITKFIASILFVIATYVVISVKLPIFLCVGIPLLGFAFLVQRIFAASIRQLKRIELATQSPILSHFSETVAGSSSIRAFSRQREFTKKFGKLLDFNQTAFYASQATIGWLLVRTEFVGVTIVFIAATVGVVQRETLEPSAVGLALAFATSVGHTLFWAIQHASFLESNIVSVERLDEYNSSPKEQPWTVPEIDKSSDIANWPSEGGIVFDNVLFRYRDGLEPVFRNLSFSIRPGEKIGVVGRTGAGKSSLGVVLLRIADITGGRILIDGVDISKIGLHTLRNAITPIPQDPVLFTGTLRFNLDPFGKQPDESLKHSLELVHLWPIVDANPAGLDMMVSEGGENFSAGQRQLICMARALLRHPPGSSGGTHILLMDEATAAVDTNTDRLITEMIRQEFRDFTVITIAHRLDTVLCYDRILVLANGQVVEFDSPSYLLNDKTSYLHSLARSTGIIK